MSDTKILASHTDNRIAVVQSQHYTDITAQVIRDEVAAEFTRREHDENVRAFRRFIDRIFFIVIGIVVGIIIKQVGLPEMYAIFAASVPEFIREGYEFIRKL